MKTYYWSQIEFINCEVYINGELYSSENDFYNDIDLKKIIVL